MSEYAVRLQPAYILQSTQFRESSLLLDILTEDYGRLAILAKGARKSKNRPAAILQPFTPLQISYTGRSELKVLAHSETLRPYTALQGMAIYCGFYVNELVQRLLYKHDPHPEVFYEYDRCLQALAGGERGCYEGALRCFEINLLRHAGYGLQLDHAYDTGMAVDAAKRYGFQAHYGVYEDRDGMFSGKTLIAVHQNNFAEADMRELKKLMRAAIDSHLSAPLKSRSFIVKIRK
jgi:DNA repair protein RecO (recombination protein O)